VIAEHDNADYIDPDVRAVLAEFGAGTANRGIRLSRWPV
jgi:hypothetical protein